MEDCQKTLSPLHVRPFTANDCVGDSAVQVLSWHDAYQNILPDTVLHKLTVEGQVRRFQNNLHRYGSRFFNNDGFIWLVAENTNGDIVGRICGSIGAHPQPFSMFSARLHALYVLPKLVGSGVGFALWQAFIAELKTREVSSVFCGCLQQNTVARRFYTRQGGILLPHQGVFSRDGAQVPEVYFGWPTL